LGPKGCPLHIKIREDDIKIREDDRRAPIVSAERTTVMSKKRKAQPVAPEGSSADVQPASVAAECQALLKSYCRGQRYVRPLDRSPIWSPRIARRLLDTLGTPAAGRWRRRS
jgi:hypothetical protein